MPNEYNTISSNNSFNQVQVGLQAPAPAQVPDQPANVVAQPTAPQLVDATPRSLVVANSVRLQHDKGNVETNKALEVKISRLASESAAAHHTVDALLKSVFKLAETVEGEKTARVNLLAAYMGADASASLSAIGQNDAGAFGKLVNDVLHNKATHVAQGQKDGAHAAIQGEVSDLKSPSKNTKTTDQAWTLREKGTAFFSLTNSTYFNTLVQNVKSTAIQAQTDQAKGLTDSPAQKKIGELRQQVDVDRILQLKPPEPSKDGGHSTRTGLDIYTGINESGKVLTENPELYEVKAKDGTVNNPAALEGAKKGSLSANQAAYRALPTIKDEAPGDKPKTNIVDKNRVFTTAQQLKDEGRLTERELRVAQSSPRNHISRTDYQFGTNEGFSENHALNQDSTLSKEEAYQLAKAHAFKADSKLGLDQVIVQRGNGFAVWNVKKGTGFDKDAQAHAKPTVAGPSGTTDRFMTAARLLGPATIKDLGLQGPKADTQLKELTRWLATGYLVDDNHHSMVEVSLGAANHGLDAQWGSELYVAPFSEEIESSKFNISSDQVLNELGDMPDVKVDRNYRRDLRAGLDWKSGDEDFTLKVQLNPRGDINLKEVNLTAQAKKAAEELAKKEAEKLANPDAPPPPPPKHLDKNGNEVVDKVAELAKKVMAELAQPVETPIKGEIPVAPPFVKIEKNYRQEQLAKQNAANQAQAVETPASTNTPQASE